MTEIVSLGDGHLLTARGNVMAVNGRRRAERRRLLADGARRTARRRRRRWNVS